MNVVLYGATGMIGSRVLAELVSRGHKVTAVVRDASKVPHLPGVTPASGDMLDQESVAATAKGADAAISAFSPGIESPGDVLSQAFRALLRGLDKVGVRRLVAVGGAGSLNVAPGLPLVDSPNFPPAWKAIALAHSEALEILRGSDLDWTSLCPAAMIEPGQRTGKFRIGTDQLVTDAKGESRISAEDYAIAMVDELEHPKHIRQRFTVAY